MKLGDTIFNGNQFKNVILNSTSYKRLILGVNLVWSYFGIAINAFRTRILADGGTYEGESILEDRLQEITPSLFDSASLVITPNGVKTSKLYSIKPNDGTGDLTVVRNTSATRIDENGNIVNVSANLARIDYTTGSPAILVEPQRTNLVFPSNIATTQVRAVTAVAHTLSFYGTGTVTLSGAFSGSLVGTGTNNRVSLTFTPTAGNLTLTVNGSVTNWQLEAGSNATSYIPTVSGSVTRNADFISKSGISNLIGQTEGTMYWEGFLTRNSSTERLFAISNSAISNRAVLNINNNRIELINRSNNTNGSGSISGSSLSEIKNGLNKIAVRYQSGNTALYVNGVLVNLNTQTFNYTSTIDSLFLVSSEVNSSNNNNASIKFAILSSTILNNQQLQQLTTL